MILYTTEVDQSIEYQLATKLHKLLAKQRMITAKPNLSNWANDIRRMLSTNKARPQDIEQTITWLEKHHKDKYTPKIRSAMAFRQKYQRIRDAIERNEPAPQNGPDQFTKKIVNDNGYRWPHNITEEQVLQFVQTTADNYRKFLYGLQVIVNEKPIRGDVAGTRLQRFARYVLDLSLNTRAFTEQWIVVTHRILSRYSNWHGKLANWAMELDNRRFNRLGSEWAAEWCSDGTMWNKLIARIRKEAP